MTSPNAALKIFFFIFSSLWFTIFVRLAALASTMLPDKNNQRRSKYGGRLPVPGTIPRTAVPAHPCRSPGSNVSHTLCGAVSRLCPRTAAVWQARRPSTRQALKSRWPRYRPRCYPRTAPLPAGRNQSGLHLPSADFSESNRLSYTPAPGMNPVSCGGTHW